MRISWDPWQKEFLETKGNKILCCGRQVGKSEIASADAGSWAVKHHNKTVLMIAPTERQAYYLFSKTLDYLTTFHLNKIKTGRDRPTKEKIQLTNGTIIYCLPTGTYGVSIRGYTVNRLYVDEASRVGIEVFDAVTPSLLTTGGDMILLSTPFGCQGYFYECFINKGNAFNSFYRFSIDSEKVIRERKICATWTEAQRQRALEHLEREKATKSKNIYAQEYYGHFVDALMQFFPSKLIQECQKRNKDSPIPHGYKYMGCDFAAAGADETALLSVVKTDNRKVYMFDLEVTEQSFLPDTILRIKAADKKNDYQKIYCDSGGLGVGITHNLLRDDQTKRKIVELNNSSRSVTRDNKHTKRILKEDLYANLLHLMESGAIELWDDPRVFHSLSSIQCEYDNNKFKISGSYSHICEALIRAAWSVTEKSLNLWVRYK